MLTEPLLTNPRQVSRALMLRLLPILALISLLPAQTALPKAEADAFALKGQGRYAESQTAFIKLLQSASDDARGAALREFYATTAHLLTARTGDLSISSLFDELTNSESTRGYPALRDRLQILSLNLASRRGDVASVAQKTQELGYLTEWQIVGPFDNERGSAFAQAFALETSLDLKATYEGKKRPVSWRPLPVPHLPAGTIAFDSMLRPNQQVAAFAATSIRSETAREAVLYLGSGGSYKVFLNGQLIAGRDIRRAYAADQDAVPMRLAAGANLLLIKLCTQRDTMRLSARLRAADGTALRDVTNSARPEDITLAAQTKPQGKAEWKPRRGALTLFADSVEASGSPVDAFRLSYLLALSQPDDPANRRDLKYAQIAVAGIPESTAARYLLAFTRLRSGAKAEEKDENSRRREYEEILQREPGHCETLRSLAELELDSTGAAPLAETLIQRALKANPNFVAGRLLLARIYSDLDMAVLSDMEIERAAKKQHGHRHPAAAERLFGLLVRQDRTTEAEALAMERLANNYGNESLAQLITRLLKRGERETAVRLLETGVQQMPFSQFPHTRLARLFESEGNLDKAIEELREWLTICPEDDKTLANLARLLGLSGKRELQLETLRAALDLNPNRGELRRYYEFLSADEKPFYNDYQLNSTEVLAADPGPPEDAKEANDPVYYVLRQKVVRAYRNGTTSSYEHEIVRILTESGAKQWNEHYVRHFYGEQRARLLSMLVRKSDGQVLRPQLRSYYAKLPPIEPGDIIEFTQRIDDTAPNFFGDYFGLAHGFAAPGGVPSHRAELILILDPERDYRFQAANGAPEGTTSRDAENRIIRRYSMIDQARLGTEEGKPNWTESEPLVRITTYKSWESFSQWWYNLVRKQSEISPNMRAKVTEITKGLETDDQKINAIYKFVTTDIRYKAWEFGVHGYKPYTTPVIFERRHGDCKDKALLLNAMLSQVGVEAYPVLIHADSMRSHDDLSLPLVQHFNHCISYLPATDNRPEMFLDGTATYHPVDTLPDMDRGAEVLVVRDGKADIRDIAWTLPEQNADRCEYHIELDTTGNAKVSMRETPLQNEAVWMRDYLGNEPGKREENVQRYLSRSFGRVEIDSVEVSDLLDLDQPAKLSSEFKSPGFAAVQDEGITLKAVLSASPMQRLTSAKSRQFPLLLGTPSSQHQVINYKLPLGFAPLNLPEPVTLKTRTATFRMTWSFQDGVVRVERELATLINRVEPQEYPEFREFSIRVDQADQQVVIAKKEGK